MRSLLRLLNPWSRDSEALRSNHDSNGSVVSDESFTSTDSPNLTNQLSEARALLTEINKTIDSELQKLDSSSVDALFEIRATGTPLHDSQDGLSFDEERRMWIPTTEKARMRTQTLKLNDTTSPKHKKRPHMGLIRGAFLTLDNSGPSVFDNVSSSWRRKDGQENTDLDLVDGFPENESIANPDPESWKKGKRPEYVIEKLIPKWEECQRKHQNEGGAWLLKTSSSPRLSLFQVRAYSLKKIVADANNINVKSIPGTGQPYQVSITQVKRTKKPQKQLDFTGNENLQQFVEAEDDDLDFEANASKKLKLEQTLQENGSKSVSNETESLEEWNVEEEEKGRTLDDNSTIQLPDLTSPRLNLDGDDDLDDLEIDGDLDSSKLNRFHTNTSNNQALPVVWESDDD